MSVSNYIKKELNIFLAKRRQDEVLTDWDKGRAAGLLEIKKMLDKEGKS